MGTKELSFGGGSFDTIDSLPAISETLCCEERRRGLGAEGERLKDGRLLGLLSSLKGRDCISGVVHKEVRETAEEEKPERVIGDSKETGSVVKAPKCVLALSCNLFNKGRDDELASEAASASCCSNERVSFGDPGSMKLPCFTTSRSSSWDESHLLSFDLFVLLQL